MSATNYAPSELKPPKKEFINYIHNFRGIAIIFVVACHLLLNWDKNSKVEEFLFVFWGNGTVLFVFIAGYLFQHLSKKFEYRNYLVKKFQNIILPYFIISTPIIVYRIIYHNVTQYVLIPHPDFYSWSAIKQTIYFLTHGAHLQPLWFVPMISLFYLSAPLFIFIDRNPRLYFLLIPFAILSLLVYREPFSDIPRMFVHFISVYMFGMFMSRYKNQYIEFAKKYWILISCLTIGVFIINLIYCKQLNNPLNYLHKMLFCCFFIYWGWRLDKYIPKFLGLLADYSFGIFFIHYYFILIFKYIFEKVFNYEIPGNLANWTLELVLVILGSMLFIKIVKLIFHQRSRNIIGC
jgi:surface polysaccharide O-acyltransferase-like enzyme